MSGNWEDYQEAPEWSSDGSLSEADALELLLSELRVSDWRVLDAEVHGRHLMGSDVRVDAVLEPPEPELWHPHSRVWVLEAKKPVLPGDAKDHAALVVQAVDYRYVNWDGFGPRPVMIWPEPFRAHIGGDTNTVARSILSKFGVLCWRWESGHGWWLGKGSTRMWSQRAGATSHAKRWDMLPKWGSQ